MEKSFETCMPLSRFGLPSTQYLQGYSGTGTVSTPFFKYLFFFFLQRLYTCLLSGLKENVEIPFQETVNCKGDLRDPKQSISSNHSVIENTDVI